MELMPAIRALHLGALALLAGGFAFPLFVLPPSAAGAPERIALQGWLARTRIASVLIALLTWLAWLLAVAVGMSGLPLAEAWGPSVLDAILLQTRFGHAWSIRLGLMLLLVCHLAWKHRGRTSQESDRDMAGTTLGASVLVSQVWAGHATAAPLTHIVADALHLLAAALWVGCLPPLLAVLTRARTGDAAWRRLAAMAARGFTALGACAVGVLAVTGFINGRMMVGTLQELATTNYGRLLAAKIVLFATMIVLAAINRFRLTPQLEPGNPQAGIAACRLWPSVAAEIAFGACVFAIVGALGGSAPPAHEPGVGAPMQHRMGSSPRQHLHAGS